ncbi:MAG: AraC family transcriptional regulator [Clostridia bacterium]|jgi:AraC-like DNA-binding protein/mannose-6-phosphate isomerase-like protein (cupin superfamily)|nr:AraC family transcriptional regulator [Clostridia bacterium]
MANRRYTINQQESIRKLDSKLLYVSASKYEGDWQSTMHSHYFAEIFYVQKGSGSFMVGDKMFSVKESDLIIINPNIEHTEKSYNATPLEYTVLGIDGLTFSFNKGDTSAQYSVYNFSNHEQYIQLYLTSMLSEIEEQRPQYELVCQNLLELLLIQIMRHADYNLIATKTIMSKKISKECSTVKRYLDSNYSEHITLDKLAKMTHMNKYYLIHVFTKYSGMSPINYLNNRRIEEGKMLLETTDFSVMQISSSIGFSSQAYFAQAFKKSLGISPNEYRKQKKQFE